MVGEDLKLSDGIKNSIHFTVTMEILEALQAAK